MTGPRLRRLLVLIVLGTIVIRVVRGLRGSATRVFDRPSPSGLPRSGDEPPPPAGSPVSPPMPVSPSPDPSPAPEPANDTDRPTWALPVDGACPAGYPVKAKLRSGIFHLPGMSAYDRTTPDRCYPDADAASADGLRIAKR